MAVTPLQNGSDSYTVAYNGYVFPTSRDITLSWQAEYDEAGLTVIGKRGTLTVSGVVTDPSSATIGSIETTIANMECALLKAGGQLTIENTGIPDLNINESGGDSDLRWGPKPTSLVFHPAPGGMAAEYEWVCEFFVPACCLAVNYTLPVALNVSIKNSADAAGWITRTQTGYLQIAQTRIAQGNKKITRTADQVYKDYWPKVPFGMRRVSHERTLSADACRLDFSIVDEEIKGDNAFPVGIVNASMPIRVRNRSPQNFQAWTVTIGGDFERARGYPANHAFQRWFLMVVAYIESIARKGPPRKIETAKDFKIENLQSGDAAVSIVPVDLSIETDPYTTRSSFGITLDVIVPMSDFYLGMWDPVPGADWEKWQKSLEQTWNPFGFSDPEKPLVIVDLCVGKPLLEPKTDEREAIRGTLKKSPYIFDSAGINPLNSWRHYKNDLEIDTNYRHATHGISQTYSPRESKDPLAPQRQSTKALVIAGQGSNATSAIKADVTSFDGIPDVTFRMYGNCIRAKYEPSIPALESIDGIKPVEIRRKVRQSTLGNTGSDPIYGAEWSIWYRVPLASSADIRLPPPPSIFDEK